MRIAIVAFAPLIALAVLGGAPPSGHAAGGGNVLKAHDIFLTSEWDRRKPPEKVRSVVEMDGGAAPLRSERAPTITGRAKF